MVIVLVGLYIYTNAQAGRTTWLEAEEVACAPSVPGEARIQDRKELEAENFRLWTGRKQVLFIPTANGQSITFTLPVDQPGNYELAAVVTKGPEYGKFSAMVNGQPVAIGYSQTQSPAGGKRYQVVKLEAPIYDAGRKAGEKSFASPAEGITAPHVVSRVLLGTHRLAAGAANVTVRCEDFIPNESAIGIDQWILTRTGP